MFPLQKLIRALLVTGTIALCSVTALAADSSAVPYEAAVTDSAAVLAESPASDADCVGTLEKGDTVVLLSLPDEDGWCSAAYQEEDNTVLTGYLSADAVSVQTRGTVSVLSDGSALLEAPDADSEVVTSLGQGASLEVCGYQDGWFLVRAKGEFGYIPLSDVACDVTTTTKLKLRSEPNTDCTVLETLDKHTELTPIAAEDGWYLVAYGDQQGYVCCDYVAPKDEERYRVEDPSVTEGEAVLAYARQFLGNRYVWGGTSLTSGCDCSGYVMQIFAHFGVSLPHSSSAIRNYGTRVSYSEMQVGDVVCYSGHVGIYAGNGQIINALNSRAGICYTSVNFSSIVTIRRML